MTSEHGSLGTCQHDNNTDTALDVPDEVTFALDCVCNTVAMAAALEQLPKEQAQKQQEEQQEEQPEKQPEEQPEVQLQDTTLSAPVPDTTQPHFVPDTTQQDPVPKTTRTPERKFGGYGQVLGYMCERRSSCCCERRNNSKSCCFIRELHRYRQRTATRCWLAEEGRAEKSSFFVRKPTPERQRSRAALCDECYCDQLRGDRRQKSLQQLLGRPEQKA